MSIKMKSIGLVMIGVTAGVMLSLNFSAIAQREATRLPLPFDPDHMGLCTDPRSRPVWEEVAGWILRHA